MSQLGDRFDEVQLHARKEALALGLKFGVTDVNGWQTAYGYDRGRSRPQFERSVSAFRRDLRAAARTLTDPRERELVRRLRGRFGQFMGLDVVAYRALRDRKSTRLNSSHTVISYAVFCLNDTSTPGIYTLSLHDALPIRASASWCAVSAAGSGNSWASTSSPTAPCGPAATSGRGRSSWARRSSASRPWRGLRTTSRATRRGGQRLPSVPS